jgi:predicted small integral membrane protein
MTFRLSKILLVAAVALFHTFVVFNNTTDYFSNFQYVKHVLDMDTTYPGNDGMWRALRSPLVVHTFYIGIIAWEILTMILCWAGAGRLVRAWRKSVEEFQRAKQLSVIALTLSLLLWLVAFLTVGGEWFLMWQSKIWNGQEAASRMFAVVGIVLLLLVMPESETQP